MSAPRTSLSTVFSPAKQTASHRSTGARPSPFRDSSVGRRALPTVGTKRIAK